MDLLDVRGNQGKVDLKELIELLGIIDYTSEGHANKCSHNHYMKNQNRGPDKYQRFKKDGKLITNRLLQL